MAPNKENKDKWEESESKRLIRAGIIDGTITEEMSVEEIREMDPEIHGKHPWSTWKSNVDKLRKTIQQNKDRAMEDWLSYKIDLCKLKKIRSVDRKVPWHLSEAFEHLKIDMSNGLHEAMKPKELYETRDSYQQFDLKTFRKHIYQRRDAEAKRQWRFEKKLKTSKYPERLQDHPRYPK